MKIAIDAAPGELAARAGELLKALAADLAPASTEARTVLEALEHAEDEARASRPMRDPKLEALRVQVAKVVGQELRALREDIEAQAADELDKATYGLQFLDDEIRKAYEGSNVRAGLCLDGTVWVEPLCDDFEKGRTHKYLARYPTGNPKRPWRYVYKYTGKKDEPSIKIHMKTLLAGQKSWDAKIHVGSKFKDRATDHEGHWEVTSVDGGAVTLKHDETGEILTIRNQWDLRRHLTQGHEAELEAAESARVERRKQEARASFRNYQAARQAFEKEPSLVNLKRQASEWERHKRVTQEIHVTGTPPEDIEAIFGVVIKEPKTWKGYLEQLRAAQATLKSTRGMASERHPDPRVRAAYILVRRWEAERPKAAKDARVIYLDEIMRELARKGAGDNPSKKQILAALGKNRSEKLIVQQNSSEIGPTEAKVLETINDNPDVAIYARGFFDGPKDVDYNVKGHIEDAIRVLTAEYRRPVLYGDSILFGLRMLADNPVDLIDGLMRNHHSNLGAPSAEDKKAALEVLKEQSIFALHLPSKKAWDGLEVSKDDYIRAAMFSAPTEIEKARAEHEAEVTRVEAAIEDVKKATGDMHQKIAEIAEGLARENGVTIDPKSDHVFLGRRIARELDPKGADAPYNTPEGQAYEAQAAKFKEEFANRVFEHLVRSLAPTTSIKRAKRYAKAYGGSSPEGQAWDPGDDPLLNRVWRLLHKDNIPKTSFHVNAGSGRAHAARGSIQLFTGDTRGDVAAHEYGHEIEHVSRGVTRAANAFRDQRGRNSIITHMREASGDGGYENHEWCYPNRAWRTPYASKWYGHNASTEVLSMGVQYITNEPVDFFAEDPEHAYFTLAALTGRLGSADKNAKVRA